MVEALIQREFHRAAKRVGSELNIGVGENDPTSSGELISLVKRMGLAEPAGRKRSNVQNAEPGIVGGEIFHNAARGICGTVIHSDDFVIGIIEGEHGLKRGGEFIGFVARSEDYGNARATFDGKRRDALKAREPHDADPSANTLNHPNNCNGTENQSY
jgi:hypothetical protein